MKELVLANLATISLANLPFSQQPAAISSTLIEDAVTTWMCHKTQLIVLLVLIICSGWDVILMMNKTFPGHHNASCLIH